MGRKRSYWLHERTQTYYTTHNGRKVKLGIKADPIALIEGRFNELLKLSAKDRVPTVGEIVNGLMAFNQAHRSKGTDRWYRDFLVPFLNAVKPSMPYNELTPSMVNRWIDDNYQGAASTRNGAARAVSRAFNWAEKERIIPRTPLIGLVKPTPSNREVTITPTQFKRCVANAKGPFRDVVEFLWHSGCRPQELRAIEHRFIEGNRIVLPVAKSKGKKRRCVIYMDETAMEIVARLACDCYEGPIFLNSRGKPWTKDAITSAFRRLKKKTGIDGLCAYAFRHGYATETIKRGVDTVTVAALMNNSPRVVGAIYQHVAQDQKYLTSIVNGNTAV